MHNGVPPHPLLAVGEFLNIVFPKQWIGWSDPVACPAPSPDLNLLVLFLSGNT
jgi:hypothetical protein